ncbi:hypothetical protein ABT369_32200 [Dactylosporangium sp. NPDC000244]|uniref:hypothetical protein n=1 Tax=Dactylosporangium sp. NPDC000244 TaxID=3154365 RepID=UPI003323EA64
MPLYRIGQPRTRNRWIVRWITARFPARYGPPIGSPIGRPNQRALVLRWLEESCGNKEPVDLGTLTIEHVMP